METLQAERKPFNVDAVRVTAENIDEVAAWCGGDVRHLSELQGERPYIKVRVQRPMDEKQTMAFIGDWVLYAGTGYKVYGNHAFTKSFNVKTGVRQENTGGDDNASDG